jgi:cell wall-associated NlpC family hydrolase
MKYKKVVISLLLCILLSSSMVSFTMLSQQNPTSYEMYVNNQRVGVVKYAARGLTYYDTAMQQLSKRYPDDVNIRSEVYFKEISESSSIYSSESQIIEAMRNAIEVEINAYSININGQPICYVQTLEEAEHLAETIKAPYEAEVKSQDNTQLEEVTFSEILSFDPVMVAFDELVQEQEALTLLQQSSNTKVEHIASDHDTLWDLAMENDLTIDEIISLNPNINPEKIKPGQTIILSAEKKLLNVVTKEVITYEEEVPFEKKKQDDNTLLKGKTKTIQEGEKGTKEIQARIIRENGVEISREVIQQTMTKEPVDEILAVGTKEPPKPTPKPSRGSSSSSSSSSSGSTKDAPAPSNGSVTGQDIADYAMKFLGCRYVRGGNGPKSFDCSGLTSYVYRQFGYSLYRRSRDQALNGVAVSKSDLAPGDLVLFNNKGTKTIGHVGIYIGNGKMIHASTSKTGVIISDINSGSYPSRYNCARRIIR